ncbi:MAG: GNAT family N-acetyltransferase [Cyanobacteria bacterium P01_D01_bin.156]
MTQDRLESKQHFSAKIDRTTWRCHLDSHHQMILGVREFFAHLNYPPLTDQFLGLLRFRCFETAGPKAELETLAIKAISSDTLGVEVSVFNRQEHFSDTFTVRISDIKDWSLSRECLLHTQRLEIVLLLSSHELQLTTTLKEPLVWQMRGAHYSPMANLYSTYEPSQDKHPWYKYYFAIRLTKSQQTIGFIGFYQISQPKKVSPHISQIPYQSVMLSYGLAKDYWGHGLMSEALRDCVPWFIKNHQVQELVAFAEINNLGSRHILKKLELLEYGLLENSLNSPDLKDTYHFMIYKQ